METYPTNETSDLDSYGRYQKKDLNLSARVKENEENEDKDRRIKE